jgi:transposase
LEKSSQLDGVSLNEKKRAAVELLALGKSYTLAAKTVGVDRRTIFEWRQEQQFQSELRRRHQELWGDATERLQMLADPSIEVLVEHLNDRYDRSRFRAATTILKLVKLGRKEPGE